MNTQLRRSEWLREADLKYIEAPLFAHQDLEDGVNKIKYLDGLSDIIPGLFIPAGHPEETTLKLLKEQLEEGLLVILKEEPFQAALKWVEHWAPDFGSDDPFDKMNSDPFQEKLHELDDMFTKTAVQMKLEEWDRRGGKKKIGTGHWTFNCNDTAFRGQMMMTLNRIKNPPAKYLPARPNNVENWNEPLVPEKKMDDSIPPTIPNIVFRDDDINLTIRFLDAQENPVDDLEPTIKHSGNSELTGCTVNGGYLYLLGIGDEDIEVFVHENTDIRLKDETDFKEKQTLKAENDAEYVLILQARHKVTD